MNKALTSKYAVEDHYYPLNLAYYKLLQVLLASYGEDEDKWSVLQPVCESHLKVLEARKNNWVQFYVAALSSGVDIDSLPDIGSCSPLDVDSIVMRELV